MALDAWLPKGFELPDGARISSTQFAGEDWQIYTTAGGGRALVVHDGLADRWFSSGLVNKGTFNHLQFGNENFYCVSSGPSQRISIVREDESPDSKTQALSFALAMKATRDIDAESPLQDAIYVEKISRLLPTYSITPEAKDDLILGYWLTGGTNTSVTSFRRLHQLTNWITANNLRDVVQAAGFEVRELMASGEQPDNLSATPTLLSENQDNAKQDGLEQNKLFELPGRPNLAAFFNEHIIDIIRHRDRYEALGINFPSAVILHGPPGCGKTFAVEKLIEFLGWPSFEIDAASVASPYIHETSKKVAQVFDKAIENSPSVLVIDEMEAFLADREMGASHHRIEEVAEFLRRIPEAVKNNVLIIAMTNRIDLIDPAIQRRGRFDHVIKIDFASETEVKSLIDNLLASLPTEQDVDSTLLARELAGRPLSDVSFVVREGARLAARSGKSKLDQNSLLSGLRSSPARGDEDDQPKKRIGFY